MQFSRLALLLVLAAASQIILSCTSQTDNTNIANSNGRNSANANSQVPKDNVEKLGLLVRLPFEPEEVAWEENPETKSLTAVIRFSPENAGKMAAEIAKNGQPTPDQVSVESWFPNELLAQGELTGESIVKGHSFPAAPYLNPPYTTGKITQIENTDYFILQISS
jgi:hypothetical protein